MECHSADKAEAVLKENQEAAGALADTNQAAQKNQKNQYESQSEAEAAKIREAVSRSCILSQSIW